MKLYQFSAGDSFLHSLDPRSKLLVIACLLVATFLFPHAWVMPLIPILMLWALGKIPPWKYGGVFLFLLPLMAGIILIQVLSGGAPYLPLKLFGLISLSEPGLSNGLLVAFRLTSMGVAFLMFSMTTDPFDWGLSMYKSGLPYRVAFMFAFAMRFFPLLQEELGVIRNALSARGSDSFSLSRPGRFLRGVAISVLPLGVGALRRSQDIALAMELRGFGYAEEVGIKRTLFRDIRLRPRDYLVMVCSVLFLAAVIAYAARAGTLPKLTSGQKVFAGVLLALFGVVAVVITRALGGSRNRMGHDPQPVKE